MEEPELPSSDPPENSETPGEEGIVVSVFHENLPIEFNTGTVSERGFGIGFDSLRSHVESPASLEDIFNGWSRAMPDILGKICKNQDKERLEPPWETMEGVLEQGQPPPKIKVSRRTPKSKGKSTGDRRDTQERKKPYHCRICYIDYYYLKSAEEHVKSKHQIPPEETTSFIETLSEFKKQVRRKPNIPRKPKQSHSSSEPTSTSGIPKSPKVSTDTPKPKEPRKTKKKSSSSIKPYICRVCSSGYSSRKSTREHLRAKHGVKADYGPLIEMIPGYLSPRKNKPVTEERKAAIRLKKMVVKSSKSETTARVDSEETRFEGNAVLGAPEIIIQEVPDSTGSCLDQEYDNVTSDLVISEGFRPPSQNNPPQYSSKLYEYIHQNYFPNSSDEFQISSNGG